MILALTPCLGAALLLVGARHAGRTAAPAAARAVAVAAATAATVVAAVGWPLALLDPLGRAGPVTVLAAPGGPGPAWALTAAVGTLLATALAPVATHPPPVQRRILLLAATAAAGTATDQPGLAVALWAAGAGLLWSWLDTPPGAAGRRRLFGLYHGLSVAAVALGALVTAVGAPRAGAVLLAAGVLVRVGAPPAHAWLPVCVGRTPPGLLVAFLTTVPVGLSLLARAPVPAGAAAAVGACGALGAGLLAVVQRSVWRCLAYLLAAQAALEVAAWGTAGAAGVALGWGATMLGGAGLLMTTAALEARRGPLHLGTPLGNLARTPRLAWAFLVCGLAGAGFPALAGFVGAELAVHAGTAVSPWWTLPLAGAVSLAGVTVLRAYTSLFTGRRDHPGHPDLTRRETYALGVALAAVVCGGLAPGGVAADAPAPPPAGRHG
ncbi:hypothetical protein GCM10010124_12450 [Pilimelia terevasa]|uniref:NADH:quinone oxidoreductase/Mrp antiporter transmembrane domain-containing protein n=1 Tax=Pilimelia terevasa TaxID=53372 RepID=A0A8J3BR01_9ACTN|nr:proton-conducting transporter membrane subunit [Pilimelia terevasa]GGK21494.1 hypothetical protein GCM10010124_12450 [Pilimelia terevasa]